jgi:hypothetical protein
MEWIGGQPGPKVTPVSPALSVASCSNLKDSSFIQEQISTVRADNLA